MKMEWREDPLTVIERGKSAVKNFRYDPDLEGRNESAGGPAYVL
jgi:hypothetical protein